VRVDGKNADAEIEGELAGIRQCDTCYVLRHLRGFDFVVTI